VALGVREDGQKVLLAVKNMGSESEAAWRALLDDLVKRGLKTARLRPLPASCLDLSHRDDFVISTRAVND
jgi:hypothetical protein